MAPEVSRTPDLRRTRKIWPTKCPEVGPSPSWNSEEYLNEFSASKLTPQEGRLLAVSRGINFQLTFGCSRIGMSSLLSSPTFRRASLPERSDKNPNPPTRPRQKNSVRSISQLDVWAAECGSQLRTQALTSFGSSTVNFFRDALFTVHLNDRGERHIDVPRRPSSRDGMPL